MMKCFFGGIGINIMIFYKKESNFGKLLRLFKPIGSYMNFIG